MDIIEAEVRPLPVRKGGAAPGMAWSASWTCLKVADGKKTPVNVNEQHRIALITVNDFLIKKR